MAATPYRRGGLQNRGAASITSGFIHRVRSHLSPPPHMCRSFFHLRQLGGHAGGGAAALDNPDQRICDDVGAFCRSSTSIALALVKKIMNSVAFASEWGEGGGREAGQGGGREEGKGGVSLSHSIPPSPSRSLSPHPPPPPQAYCGAYPRCWW